MQSFITTPAVMFPDFHYPLCVYARISFTIYCSPKQNIERYVSFHRTDLIQRSTFDIEQKFCIDNYYDKINLFKFVFMWLSVIKPWNLDVNACRITHSLPLWQPVNCIFWPLRMLNCLVAASKLHTSVIVIFHCFIFRIMNFYRKQPKLNFRKLKWKRLSKAKMRSMRKRLSYKVAQV